MIGYIKKKNIAQIEIVSWGKKIKITNFLPGEISRQAKAPIHIIATTKGTVRIHPSLYSFIIKKGATLCFIENGEYYYEIKSPSDGKVVIHASNDSTVVHGQLLFKIIPSPS